MVLDHLLPPTLYKDYLSGQDPMFYMNEFLTLSKQAQFVEGINQEDVIN